MIDFTFLNWEFDKYLYSTEVVETSFVQDLIKKIDELSNVYGVTSVYPISDIFWRSNNKIDFEDVKKFLEKSLIDCRITEDRDLVAYQRLLGPELRHGPGITKELIDTVQSVMDGGGKYDHVKIIDDFLDNPYSGVSFAMITAIKEARIALESLKRKNPDFGKPTSISEFLKYLDIDTSGIDQETLNKPLKIFIDDGMGYGAKNGDCLAVEVQKDEVRVWM